MKNPFELIDSRLNRLEGLLLELKNDTIPQLLDSNNDSNTKIVDLTGLLAARPIVGTRSTIYKKISRGLIPHSKRGKKVYFNLDEIDEWLLANRVSTVEERKETLYNHLQQNRK